MIPASMLTWSDSTSFRALAIVVAGRPSLSSRMTSSFRPAICQPLSSQKSSQPLYMSLPAWAMAPDSGARKPILTGPWASASPARPSEHATASETIAISSRIASSCLAVWGQVLHSDIQVDTTSRSARECRNVRPDPGLRWRRAPWYARRRPMKRSTERILTTHTGSLPRPDDLTRTMFAKEEGVPVDSGALAARIRSAVAEVVRKQVEVGVDVVNDGEYSKPSYATYVKDRLRGFGGASQPLQYRDLVDFPGMARRVFGDPGRARRRAPACTEAVAVQDAEAARTDVANLRTAAEQGTP